MAEREDLLAGDGPRLQDDATMGTVLLVDDEHEFTAALSERLALRGLDTRVAHDGQTALEVIERLVPRTVILDLNMPEMSGFEVLRLVKVRQPQVAVIILSGHSSQQDREVCLEMGAFACLQKPVSIDRLMDCLRRASARQHRDASFDGLAEQA